MVAKVELKGLLHLRLGVKLKVCRLKESNEMVRP